MRAFFAEVSNKHTVLSSLGIGGVIVQLGIEGEIARCAERLIRKVDTAAKRKAEWAKHIAKKCRKKNPPTHSEEI